LENKIEFDNSNIQENKKRNLTPLTNDNLKKKDETGLRFESTLYKDPIEEKINL